MQTINLDQLERHLTSLPVTSGIPRVVVSGNGTTPWAVVEVVDRSIEKYRIHALNAGTRIPVREGVIAETAFVGPGMRKHPALS